MIGIGQYFKASRRADISDRGTATAAFKASKCKLLSKQGNYGFNVAAQQVSSSSVSLRYTVESAYNPSYGNIVHRKPSLRVETSMHDTGLNGTPGRQSATATPCQNAMKPWLTPSPNSHGTNGVVLHHGNSSSVHSEIDQPQDHDSVQGA